MSFDLHQQLLAHYTKRNSIKKRQSQPKNPLLKDNLSKRPSETRNASSFDQFLKNQKQVSSESEALLFRNLPRNLKVYFPRPPSPPPQLKEVPYTYEVVAPVPYRMPRQRKGKAADWVLEESYFVQSNQEKSKQLLKKQRVHQGKSSDLAFRFRSAVKKLAKTMKEQNLSLGQIIANKGLVKKAHNFYNSKEYFALIKQGDKKALQLLQENPYLAFDVDEMKMTSLHWAARAGHAQLVNILCVKYRANTLAKDIYGRTPLHLAVTQKHIQCLIRIFIEGGKLTSMDRQKKSVRDMAPDLYTKFLLEKLEEIKFIIRGKGIKDIDQYKQQLEKQIRSALDSKTLYF